VLQLETRYAINNQQQGKQTNDHNHQRQDIHSQRNKRQILLLVASRHSLASCSKIKGDWNMRFQTPLNKRGHDQISELVNNSERIGFVWKSQDQFYWLIGDGTRYYGASPTEENAKSQIVSTWNRSTTQE